MNRIVSKWTFAYFTFLFHWYHIVFAPFRVHYPHFTGRPVIYRSIKYPVVGVGMTVHCRHVYRLCRCAERGRKTWEIEQICFPMGPEPLGVNCESWILAIEPAVGRNMSSMQTPGNFSGAPLPLGRFYFKMVHWKRQLLPLGSHNKKSSSVTAASQCSVKSQWSSNMVRWKGEFHPYKT